MLWAGALVAAVLFVVAASGDEGATIRLPSDGGKGYADLVTPAAVKASGGNEERPFTCCDTQVCALIYPPLCFCQDLVEKCSDACKNCEEVPPQYARPPYNYICRDKYRGDPAPECPQPDFVTNHGVSDLVEKEGVKTGKESCGNEAIVARKMGS